MARGSAGDRAGRDRSAGHPPCSRADPARRRMGARRRRRLAPADIIVLSLDSGGAGALEAAHLVQSGIAKRVAVFTDPPSGEDLEFIRRGLPYEDASARQIRQLRSLGVTDIVQIPRADEGTEGESTILPAWCREHHIQSLVFVAARDHSRRTRRVLERTMKDQGVRVTVQPARYSSFDPDRWWQTRGGIRIGIVELQKLLLDLLASDAQLIQRRRNREGSRRRRSTALLRREFSFPERCCRS